MNISIHKSDVKYQNFYQHLSEEDGDTMQERNELICEMRNYDEGNYKD